MVVIIYKVCFFTLKEQTKLMTFIINREPLADYFREVLLGPTHNSLFEPTRQRRREEVAKEEVAIVAVDAAIRA